MVLYTLCFAQYSTGFWSSDPGISWRAYLINLHSLMCHWSSQWRQGMLCCDGFTHGHGKSCRDKCDTDQFCHCTECESVYKIGFACVYMWWKLLHSLASYIQLFKSLTCLKSPTHTETREISGVNISSVTTNCEQLFSILYLGNCPLV